MSSTRCKREQRERPLGIVESSGRGVDTIYPGMLKFGRPAPDYGRTDAHGVVLQLPTETADRDFRRLVVEEERWRGAELSIAGLSAFYRMGERGRNGWNRMSGIRFPEGKR